MPSADTSTSEPPSERWGAASGRTRGLLWLLAGVCAIWPVGTGLVFLSMYLRGEALNFPYTDFFAFWTFGRFALDHPAGLLFDNALLHAFQQAIATVPGTYPYLYPPPIMLVLEPLGMLPYGTAILIWTGLGALAYWLALAPARWPAPLRALLLVAPTSFVCGLIGQNGLWTGAFMLGGLRLLDARPIFAGILLGLLAYKPPLAILVPLFLMVGGHRHALIAAAGTVVALYITSSAVFGAEFWFAWADSMLGQGHALATTRGHLDARMPTVTAAVMWLIGSRSLANTLQLAAALFAIWVVWRGAGGRNAAARALLPVATMLATPHAFAYDMTIVTGAVLAVIAERMTSRDTRVGALAFTFPELLVYAGAILLPLPAAHSGTHAFLALLPMLPLLLILLRHARGETAPSPALAGRSASLLAAAR